MNRTILIGLDGATFTILDAMMQDGTMPFLRGLVSSGVRGVLHSVVPALTPPAWTSLMTGKRPGEHGVFDFFQRQSPDSPFLRFASSHDIQSDTIWTLASDHGCRVCALNFPLMFPPPRLNGCVVPGGWMPWKQLRLGCYPPGLFDRLKSSVPNFHPRELSHDMELEEKALEGCAKEEYADWIVLHTQRERRWTDIALYLMREEPADLTAIMFDGVDKLQHLCWRFLDPALRPDSPTPWEQEVQSLCLDYFRRLDGLIAELVSQAGPDARIILASDHGFGPSSDIFYPNTWLQQQGYLARVGGDEPVPSGEHQVGIAHLARHVFELDWKRTVAYAATPSSQGIHIVRRSAGEESGVPPEDYHRIRGQIADGLRNLRHPETGRPVVAKVWTCEEAFGNPHRALGPDLTIMLENDGVVSILPSDTIVRSRPEPVGTHRPEGIFVATGPGFRSGETIPDLSIVDVAPLLLHCLDIATPGDMSGHLPLDALEPAAAERRPGRKRFTSATRIEVHDAQWDASPMGLDPGEEALVLRRLSALGYLE
ncbi:MAG: alkaline phosphatase family protein [Isosphaeraceae bacterium]